MSKHIPYRLWSEKQKAKSRARVRRWSKENPTAPSQVKAKARSLVRRRRNYYKHHDRETIKALVHSHFPNPKARALLTPEIKETMLLLHKIKRILRGGDEYGRSKKHNGTAGPTA